MHPRHTSNSGIKIFSMPQSSSIFKPADGFSHITIFSNSSLNRSIEMEAVFCRTSSLKGSLYVSFSILKPSLPAKRTARIGLSPSSINRSCAFPTVLIIFFLMSLRPPYGSTTFPSARFTAIAFIVKSRRERSSSIVAA